MDGMIPADAVVEVLNQLHSVRAQLTALEEHIQATAMHFTALRAELHQVKAERDALADELRQREVA